MVTQARRFDDSGFSSIPVATAPSGVNLPATLIIPPNNYAYGSVALDMHAGGLYSLCIPVTGPGDYRIVEDGIMSVMRGLAAVTIALNTDRVVGNAGNDTNVNLLVEKAKKRFICILCQQTCEWVKRMMELRGYTVRMCRAVSLAVPLTGADDTHVLLECKDPVTGKWIFFDVDLDRIWTDGAGAPLSLAEWIQPGGGIELKIAQTYFCPILNDPTNTHPYNQYADCNVRTPQDVANWTARVMQALGIVFSDNLTYFYTPNPADNAKIKAFDPNYQVLNNFSQWQNAMYS